MWHSTPTFGRCQKMLSTCMCGCLGCVTKKQALLIDIYIYLVLCEVWSSTVVGENGIQARSTLHIEMRKCSKPLITLSNITDTIIGVVDPYYWSARTPSLVLGSFVINKSLGCQLFPALSAGVPRLRSVPTRHNNMLTRIWKTAAVTGRTPPRVLRCSMPITLKSPHHPSNIVFKIKYYAMKSVTKRIR